MNTNYEERIVCFLDLLAFKELIKSTMKDSEEVFERTEFIKSLFALMIKELKNDRLEVRLPNGTSDKTVKVTHFSDSIVLSVSLNDESSMFYTIIGLQFFLLELLKHKMLIRGGIVIGQLYHDSNTVFGPALNEAYNMENKTAKNPRVIIDLSVIDYYLQNFKIRHNAQDEREYILNFLSVDTDGLAYVDYFNVDFDQFDTDEAGIFYMQYLRNIIVQNIIGYDTIPSVKKKNTWMIHKFNRMLIDKNKEHKIKFQHKFGIYKIERSQIINN